MNLSLIFVWFNNAFWRVKSSAWLEKERTLPDSNKDDDDRDQSDDDGDREICQCNRYIDI